MLKGMTDEGLARIMYLVVHDFQIEMIENGRAEKKHGLKPDSRNIAESIRRWAASGGGYPEIRRHAETVIEWIDSETFNIDSV